MAARLETGAERRPLDAVLDRALNPRAIAVAGASNNRNSFGFLFVRHLLDYGYGGSIYPVNPGEPAVQGLPSYPSLLDIPGEVDYVICCLPAPSVPGLLSDCARKGVELVHLLTGRLSETGRDEARRLESAIYSKARELGIRLIGPNCMGLYRPARGIAYDYDFPAEGGPVAAIFQSGGASGEFIRYGALRGLRYSKVISYGNGLDIDEADLLAYLARDGEATVIAAYIEGVKDGRKFLRALRDASRAKPVVVLKGGKGGAGGRRATSSHTASLAGARHVWHAALEQAGAVPAETLRDLLDLAVAFRFLPPFTAVRTAVVGGGGGKSVLAADDCEAAGLEVPPLPARAREELKSIAPEIWDWLDNPADRSMMQGTVVDTGKMLDIMCRMPEYDIVIASVTEDAPFDRDRMTRLLEQEVTEFIRIPRGNGKPLAAVLGAGEFGDTHLEDWRWKLIAAQRRRLVEAGVPVFSSVASAASCMSRVAGYYRARGRSSV